MLTYSQYLISVCIPKTTWLTLALIIPWNENGQLQCCVLETNLTWNTYSILLGFATQETDNSHFCYCVIISLIIVRIKNNKLTVK